MSKLLREFENKCNKRLVRDLELLRCENVDLFIVIEDDADTLKNITVRDFPTQESTTRARGQKGKELDSPIDEIIKSMKDLQLKLTKPEKVENFN